ncbi:hypothetical protein ALC53_11661 [Atta colombica]|uniref:Uncharacterized protein n=1 Tax=Atta colombica TaxID=520822 RepID=A0A195B0G7_9HYME|nr:hypothetical protein ALC53_11661 [Atta colombica]
MYEKRYSAFTPFATNYGIILEKRLASLRLSCVRPCHFSRSRLRNVLFPATLYNDRSLIAALPTQSFVGVISVSHTYT